MVNILPGDVADMIGGQGSSPEDVQAIREDLLKHIELAQTAAIAVVVDRVWMAAGRVLDGEVENLDPGMCWQNLDKVWQLVRDKERFVDYIQDETTEFLGTS